ncbi:uncharacterized protein LOC122510504 [Leptopilina heterotoma]|uniref:uncharacterized protein LOC122507323 n=1 Tax=Leptopilina heterotoma TaxID=63436 RepID=UPI001CA98B72|nr:uncharacterized protein LOC122507323 [Leptopilina heterotoma]XP_043481135.1 uncharacterized protein LOC122510504 [Leptopilina heterotoma]
MLFRCVCIYIGIQTSDFESLTSQNGEAYSIAKVTKNWEETYSHRMKLLVSHSKKNSTPLEVYFKTFPRLKSPLGLPLLEQDCRRIFQEIAKENNELRQLIQNNPNHAIFAAQWPTLAKKIVVYCKKSKAADVKVFLQSHENLFQGGSNDNVLALLLLPLIIRGTKKLKVDSKSINVTKEEIAKAFILHIENFENVIAGQFEFETWLTSLNLQIHPYVTIVGSLETPQIYLKLNGENYNFQDPLKALESCYRCLTALHSFPFLCDFVWTFIDKAVYKICNRKISSWVTKLLVDINK